MRCRLGLSFLSLAIVLFLCSCATSSKVPGGAGGVAVWDLDDLSPGGGRPEVGEFLTARVMAVLAEKGAGLVERKQLLRTLEELRLGSSQLADESTRLEVGRLVGAKRMVFGGYQVIGQQTMRLDLRLVDVETGRVVKAVQRTAGGDLAGWIEAAGEAAAELYAPLVR